MTTKVFTLLKIVSVSCKNRCNISFDMLLRTGLFPDSLKIAWLTPFFKAGDPKNVSKL